MSIPVIPTGTPAVAPYISPVGSLPNITPFTFRDGWTYLERYENLVKYINRVVIPFVNENYQGLADAFQTEVDRLAGLVQDAVDQVINDSIEVQDPVVATLIGDAESATREALDNLFATIDALNAVATDVDTLTTTVDAHTAELEGRLSDATLDGKYEPLGVELDTEEVQRQIALNHAVNAEVIFFTRNDPTSTSFNYSLIRVPIRGLVVPDLFTHEYANEYQNGWTPGTPFIPAVQSFAGKQEQSHTRILVNGAGWTTSGTDTGRLFGCSIRNGVVHQPMSLVTNRDAECIGLLPNGHLKVYSAYQGHTTATLTGDGVIHAWGSGPILVQNGTPRYVVGDANFGGSAEWTTQRNARTILGEDNAGNIIIITVEGSADSYGIYGNYLTDLAVLHGLTNAVCLDNGGSVQAFVDRLYATPSSDTGGTKQIKDFVGINANVISLIDTGWRNLALETGFSGVLQYRVINNTVHVRGNLLADFANGSTTVSIGRLPVPYRPMVQSAYGAGYLNGADSHGQVAVLFGGNIVVYNDGADTATGVLFTVSYPRY